MTEDLWKDGDILMCDFDSSSVDSEKYHKGQLVQILSTDGLVVHTINSRGGENAWWKAKFTRISSGKAGDLSRIAQL